MHFAEMPSSGDLKFGECLFLYVPPYHINIQNHHPPTPFQSPNYNMALAY